MGKTIASALGGAGGSAGSSIGSAIGSNVVSPVLVQAASKGASTALGSTLGRAIGAGLSSGVGSVGSAIANGGTGVSQPTTASEPSGNVVDGVTVTAPRLADTSAMPTSSGLVPSLLGALGASASSLTAPTASAAAAPPPLANVGSTEVSPVEVTAAAPQTPDISGALGAGGGAGLGDIITGATGDDVLYDEEPGQNDQLLDENGDGLKDAGMLALLAGLGLKPKDLLGMGLLGAGLVAGNKGGDGGTGPGTPTTELTNIAQGNQNLANMLSQRAQAGMSGQIGGMGMNAIKRMVRNSQAAIRQRYSGMGMSGSSAEAADLNAAAEAGVDMQFKIGQQVAQSGLQTVAALTGQSANIYTALMNAQTQKDTALGNALANFAGAVGGRLLGA